MLSVKREKLSEQQSFPLSYRQEQNGNNEKRTRREEERKRERERNILFDESLSSHCSIEIFSSRRFLRVYCIITMDRISIITRMKKDQIDLHD